MDFSLDIATIIASAIASGSLVFSVAIHKKKAITDYQFEANKAKSKVVDALMSDVVDLVSTIYKEACFLALIVDENKEKREERANEFMNSREPIIKLSAKIRILVDDQATIETLDEFQKLVCNEISSFPVQGLLLKTRELITSLDDYKRSLS